MVIIMWIIYAIASTIFAAIMSVSIKIGLKDLNPYLSLTIRTFVVFIFCFCTILINKSFNEIKLITTKNIIWLMIISVATFFTWLFYFLALKNGSVVKVMAIDKLSIVIILFLGVLFLNEKITVWSVVGIVLLISGSLLLIFQ